MDDQTSHAAAHRHPVRGIAVVIALGGALVLAGCDTYVNPGTPGPSTAQPTPSSPQPSTPQPSTPSAPTPSAPTDEGTDEGTDEPAAAPPFPADSSPDTAAPSDGALLTVTDVRVAHHPGFDRVVYEMAGTGTPGWTVGYVPEAVQDGSGMLLDLAGDGTLSVAISGSAYPADSGAVPFTHTTAVRGAGTTVVTEVQGWSVFEGLTGSFIGTSETGHPFRVFLLLDPVRVVVDVAEAAEAVG